MILDFVFIVGFLFLAFWARNKLDTNNTNLVFFLLLQYGESEFQHIYSSPEIKAPPCIRILPPKLHHQNIIVKSTLHLMGHVRYRIWPQELFLAWLCMHRIYDDCTWINTPRQIFVSLNNSIMVWRQASNLGLPTRWNMCNQSWIFYG